MNANANANAGNANAFTGEEGLKACKEKAKALSNLFNCSIPIKAPISLFLKLNAGLVKINFSLRSW